MVYCLNRRLHQHYYFSPIFLVRKADRILVLEDGEILEIGKHQKLLADPKLYAELYELQAEGYR